MVDDNKDHTDISTTNQTATVDVRSAWFSRVNWVSVVSGAAMVTTFVTGGKFSITPEQQAAIVTTIGVLAGAATWVLDTWFNHTVPPTAIKKK